jgi:hypothetical protein
MKSLVAALVLTGFLGSCQGVGKNNKIKPGF